ncbi:MAG: CDP-diacylglycerol--glycerol-3-phosphate 3-phosphatidyltransferase [Clostridiales bacterium]|nr:CDP-diacylglycerol--glycerol-3-phosphate 3-phosphatidyltransferase [Candidatus Equinaster intestinalis]
MNLPNRLTILRIIATPVFMLTLVWDFKFHYIAALLIFIAASVTDLFDGKYARKHNMVTDFGKFLDPLADKMLTTAALVGFTAKGIGMGVEWILFIVLFREFLIASLRLVAVSSGGLVIAANIWGKAKTVVQMIAVIYTIAAEILIGFVNNLTLTSILHIFTDLFLWASAVLAIISGIIYLLDNLSFIDPSK